MEIKCGILGMKNSLKHQKGYVWDTSQVGHNHKVNKRASKSMTSNHNAATCLDDNPHLPAVHKKVFWLTKPNNADFLMLNSFFC